MMVQRGRWRYTGYSERHMRFIRVEADRSGHPLGDIPLDKPYMMYVRPSGWLVGVNDGTKAGNFETWQLSQVLAALPKSLHEYVIAEHNEQIRSSEVRSRRADSKLRRLKRELTAVAKRKADS